MESLLLGTQDDRWKMEFYLVKQDGLWMMVPRTIAHEVVDIHMNVHVGRKKLADRMLIVIFADKSEPQNELIPVRTRSKCHELSELMEPRDRR
jgi:hypothetical protein